MMSCYFSESELKKATALVRIAMLDSLPEPDECKYEFSEEFRLKIEELKSAQKKQQQLRRQLIAAVAAFFIAVTMLFTFNAEVRATVITWFKEVFSMHTIYWFSGEPVDKLPVFELTDVPEGFICIYDEALINSRSMLYQNERNPSEVFSFEYSFLQADSPLTISYPDTDFTVTEVIVDGCIGDLYVSSDPSESHALIWVDEVNDVVFTITVLGDPNVMLHIAESIELVK